MQVLPQAYGGEAAMISIDKAVHARLVKEGLERAQSSPQSEALEHDLVAEGRLTRAGRYVRAFASSPRQPCQPVDASNPSPPSAHTLGQRTFIHAACPTATQHMCTQLSGSSPTDNLAVFPICWWLITQ